jgi:hypothetical protein
MDDDFFGLDQTVPISRAFRQEIIAPSVQATVVFSRARYYRERLGHAPALMKGISVREPVGWSRSCGGRRVEIQQKARNISCKVVNFGIA